FFRPAVLAGVPNLVTDDELPLANALLQFVEWGTTVVGSLAGGAIVAASGPHLAYVVNAATFALSAAFVSRIPARQLQSERSIGRGHWSDVREGFDAILGSRQLMTVLVAWTIAQVGVGCINLAEIFMARREYHSGNFGFGLMLGSSGVGLIVGGLWARAVSERAGLQDAYPRARDHRDHGDQLRDAPDRVRRRRAAHRRCGWPRRVCGRRRLSRRRRRSR